MIEATKLCKLALHNSILYLIAWLDASTDANSKTKNSQLLVYIVTNYELLTW